MADTPEERIVVREWARYGNTYYGSGTKVIVEDQEAEHNAVVSELRAALAREAGAKITYDNLLTREKLVDIIRAEYLRVYPTGNPIPFIDLARAILAAGFQYVSPDHVVVPKAALERLNQILTIPASEYVPAIRDAWREIDTMLGASQGKP